jgi:GTP-binding protein
MLLVDIRRDLQEEERMLIDLMKKSSARVVLVATKTDKLSNNQRSKRVSELTGQCGLTPVITSATTGEGMDDLWVNIIGSVQKA